MAVFFRPKVVIILIAFFRFQLNSNFITGPGSYQGFTAGCSKNTFANLYHPVSNFFPD